MVGRLPVAIGQVVSTTTAQSTVNMLIFLLLGLAVVVGIIIINEATRQITVFYAKRVRGNKMYGGQSTHLPLRLNQAGVIPIIFAVSIVLLPSLLGNFLRTAKNPALASLAQ